MNLYVIDDFYAEPKMVRQLGLKSQYIDVTKLNYPGFQSRHTYSSNDLTRQFAKILNCDLHIDPTRHTFGKFRIMLKETASQLRVHLDGLSDWTGLVYLNPNENCRGGTGFYRHRETGLMGAVDDIQARRFGYTDWQSLERNMIHKDSLNPDAWEMVDYVAMKFNRLVLFRGNHKFHCHTDSFGTGLIDGRMTQNFFFDERRTS